MAQMFAAASPSACGEDTAQPSPRNAGAGQSAGGAAKASVGSNAPAKAAARTKGEDKMLMRLFPNPPKHAVLDPQVDLLEAFALARAHETETGLDAELGAVGGAVEKLAFAVEEAVG